jgi:hypothetical protein
MAASRPKCPTYMGTVMTNINSLLLAVTVILRGTLLRITAKMEILGVTLNMGCTSTSCMTYVTIR